jgi:RNA polymerase sigma factor (sigma-70 family)
MERTDYELVKECLEGNSDSFSQLVSRYKKLVYSVVCRFTRDNEEADDMSQEVLIKIYKSLGKYNPEFKFSTWTVKVATNICLDFTRKKRLNSFSLDEFDNMTSDDNSPEDMLLKKEKALFVRSAIENLPEIYRTPIVLYHHKGMSYKEIASLLDKPISIVKNRIFRARLTLKESLSGVA